jgi:protein gp37
MKNSKISWCHHTINLWWGCQIVHEGCDNCYARALAHRWGHDVWGKNTQRREIKSWRTDLMKYQKMAEDANETHIVFIGSMMDVFEKPMQLK